MDFYQILVLALYVTQVFTKSKSRSRKYKSSSSDEDSIENLLYYKDCQRQGKTEATQQPSPLRYEPPPPPPPPPPPRQPECPFPKMCCALTCGNECDRREPSYVNRQMEPANSIQPIQPIQPMTQLRQGGMGAVQSPMLQRRKKKPNKLQPPLPSRRAFTGAKEKIKGLIAQDDDIRKILKDLVRVTMEKMNLLDMLSPNPTKTDDNEVTSPYPIFSLDDYEEF